MYPGVRNQYGVPLSSSCTNLAVPRFLQAGPLMYSKGTPSRFAMGAPFGQSVGDLPRYTTAFNPSPPQYHTMVTPSQTPMLSSKIPSKVNMDSLRTNLEESLPQRKPCTSPRNVLGEIDQNTPDMLKGPESGASKISPPTSLQSVENFRQECSSPARRMKGELVSIRVAEIEDYIQKHGTRIHPN